MLRYIGLLSSLLLLFVGCGGNSGSGDQGGAVSRARRLTLQLTRSSQASGVARNQGAASRQVRQVQPGEPAFIERLQIRLQQPQGVDLLPPQEFILDATEQETVTREVELPEPTPAEFLVLVSAFNNFDGRQTAIFIGEALVQPGQENAAITLVRNPDPRALVLIAASPANLQQTVYTFLDAAAFGFVGTPATLAVGTFEGNTGDFTFVSSGSMVNGQVTISSCTFAVTASTFSAGGMGAGWRATGHRPVSGGCHRWAFDSHERDHQ